MKNMSEDHKKEKTSSVTDNAISSTIKSEYNWTKVTTAVKETLAHAKVIKGLMRRLR
jgi:hypothetical protein